MRRPRYRCDRVQPTVRCRPGGSGTLPNAIEQNAVHLVAKQPFANVPCQSLLPSLDEFRLLSHRFRAQVIVEIAQKHHVEPAAVILRWLRQHNCVVLPKSLTPKRIADNLTQPRRFVLSEKEMGLLVSVRIMRARSPHFPPLTILYIFA